jgi:uncharacterized membrane protein
MLQKMKGYYDRSTLLHDTFDVAILIKGIDGLLEIIGGFLLLLITPAGLMKIVALLTQHELVEDPHDIIANTLLKAAHDFSFSTKYFAAFYLVSHGVIKLFLISMLWLRKLWSYPLAILFLVLFIVYQVYRYTHTHSIWLVWLSLFDLAIIVLTWLEYERLKKLNTDTGI